MAAITQALLFLYNERIIKMGKYFVRDTPLAGLEQEMMLPPNFAPRRSSSAILCGYSPHGAGVDCQSCLDHRQSRRTLVCLHITERLQAGAVTIVELAAETVRPWNGVTGGPRHRRCIGTGLPGS